MRKIFLSFLIISFAGCAPRPDGKSLQPPKPTPTAAPQEEQAPPQMAGIPENPEIEYYDLARSDTSVFQWWIDPDIKKLNFRRCDRFENIMTCQPPMLVRGLEPKEIPVLFAFYAERLNEWGSAHLSQFASILTGSIGAATAYIGGFAALSVFKEALPKRWVQFFSYLPIRGGVHILSLGTIGLLLYFTVENLMHMYRQNQVLHEMNRAMGESKEWMAPLTLAPQPLFDEFVLTFRRALYEFTHGGPSFNDRGYLIFQ